MHTKTGTSRFRTFFFPYRVNKWITFKGIVFKTAGTVYYMSLPFVVKYMGEAIEAGDIALLRDYVLYFVLYSFVLFVLRSFIKDRGWVTQKYRFIGVLQRHYFQKYIEMDNNYAEKRGVGKSMEIINKGIDIWGYNLKTVIERSTDIVFSLGFAVVLLSSTESHYSLVLVVAMVLVFVFAGLIDREILKTRRLRKDVSIGYTNHIVRILMSKFEVLQSGRWQFESERISQYMRRMIDVTKEMSFRILCFFFGNFMWLNVVAFALLAHIGVLVIQGEVSYAEFAALASMFGILIGVVRDSLRFYKDLSRDRVHVEKLLTFVEQAPTQSDTSGLPEFVCTEGKIEVDQLDFAYADAPIFSDFSFSLEGGKKTALVGVSGAGKSTLIKLLAGYLHPSGGRVVVDGQDLENISLASYYGHIGYLTQEPSVFDGTIWANLIYALPSNTVTDQAADAPDMFMRRVDTALHLAKCEFIYDLPDGLETQIGERGVRLSGGQRQRLAIAKIFLKDPQIIFLDEPTAALDSFSEEAITEAMHNLFSGRTVVIVAHRLQTVKAADDIIVLGNNAIDAINTTLDSRGAPVSLGSMILERGTHDELVKLGGYYAKMLELQSGF